MTDDSRLTEDAEHQGTSSGEDGQSMNDDVRMSYVIRLAGQWSDEDGPEWVYSQLGTLLADLQGDGFLGSSDDEGDGEPAAPQSPTKTQSERGITFSDLAVSARLNQDDALGLMICEMMRAVSADGYSSLTITRELYHIDPIYRDCFYTCYSRQHSDTLRFSQRLCFFAGEVDFPLGDAKAAQDCFVGSCVLNPTHSGVIGRTLINPRYLAVSSPGEERLRSASVRTSEFKITVMGTPLVVDAFPYRTQDGLILRCVEVTLVNLVEYYSNNYEEYSFATGSKIHSLESQYLNERTIPARGITYVAASKILSSLGFQARLHGYSPRSGGGFSFARTLHTYLDSGIPVAVNVATDDDRAGHSLLCVGYAPGWREADLRGVSPAYTFRDASPDSPLSKVIGRGLDAGDEEEASEILSAWSNAQRCEMVLASDADYRYIVMDDNQLPYRARKADHLSLYENMRNNVLLVALHKGIMMDAVDAETNVLQLLSDGHSGLFSWAGDYLREVDEGASHRVILRLFLASSRRFKRDRVEQFKELGDGFRAQLYRTIPLPHFVWVAELYLANSDGGVSCCDEGDRRAFAELVIDATSSPNDRMVDAVLIWDFPCRITLRGPDGSVSSYPKDEQPHETGSSSRIPFFGISSFMGNLSVLDDLRIRDVSSSHFASRPFNAQTDDGMGSGVD